MPAYKYNSPKKIVKPTKKEKKKITARLQKKYPQMYDPSLHPRERATYKTLSPEDKAKLLKQVGGKLKKIYGGK